MKRCRSRAKREGFGRRLLVLSLSIGTAIAMLLFCTGSASAHQVGLSRGEYRAVGDGARAEVTFSQGDMMGLVTSVDADVDGKLTTAELESARASIEESIVHKIDVVSGGVSCPGKLESVALAEEDGVRVVGHFVCATAPEKVTLTLRFLGDLAHGHRHFARALGGKEPVDAVLYAANPSLSFDVVASGASAPPPRAIQGKWSFFPLGVEHILTGYDHLVFLLGLVLIGGRIRDLLATVTAFTVAHSISLALAVLGVWAPSPSIVEPAIALSIAYVGIENFFIKSGGKRWRITFPFGLIHGFGFAGALQQIAMPRADVPWALVFFNLGVETGQLAVLAVILPLVLLARKKDAFKVTGVRVMSAGIAMAGFIWFVLRAFLPSV